MVNHNTSEDEDDEFGPQRRRQDRRIQKMYRDLYEGDGKANPSITTRLASVEENMDKISNNLTWIARLMIGLFLTTIGELALQAFKR